MKFTSALLVFAISNVASAHYIFNKFMNKADSVRQPFNNTPVTSVTNAMMRCNTKAAATGIQSLAAGAQATFQVDNGIYHIGPASMYMAKAPDGVNITEWDGDGDWFKIAEWGAKFNPFGFTDNNLNQLSFKIPASIEAGGYLVRVEQIGLHVAGQPQFYISCAQVQVTGGGNAKPPTTVKIPGHLQQRDPALIVNVYSPVPTAYTVPGPRPWSG